MILYLKESVYLNIYCRLKVDRPCSYKKHAGLKPLSLNVKQLYNAKKNKKLSKQKLLLNTYFT